LNLRPQRIRLSGVVGHIVEIVPVVVGMVGLGIVLVGTVPVSFVFGIASISGKLELRYLDLPVEPGSIFDQQTIKIKENCQ